MLVLRDQARGEVRVSEGFLCSEGGGLMIVVKEDMSVLLAFVRLSGGLFSCAV